MRIYAIIRRTLLKFNKNNKEGNDYLRIFLSAKTSSLIKEVIKKARPFSDEFSKECACLLV